MNLFRFFAVALIALGTVGLAYGGFSYTSARHRADVGGLHVDLDEHRWVSVPIWAGVAAIAGGVVLMARRRT